MNAKANQLNSEADVGINIIDVTDVIGSTALELVSSLLEAALGL